MSVGQQFGSICLGKRICVVGIGVIVVVVFVAAAAPGVCD